MAFNLNLFGTLLILTVVCSALIYGNIFHHKYCMLILNFLSLKHGKFKCLLSDNFSQVLHKTNTVGIFLYSGFHCIKGSIWEFGDLSFFGTLTLKKYWIFLFKCPEHYS